jgi:predicted permease
MVDADLARLYEGLKATSPGTTPNVGFEVKTLREDFIRDEARVLEALLAAVGFLLLLACVNVANLLTARFTTRSRELGIRAALGSGRGRQARQLLTETLVLFGMGALVGIALTAWLGEFLSILIPQALRTQVDLGEIRIDPAVLAFTALVAVLAGLLFGGIAAIRGGNPDLRTFLVQGGRGASAAGGKLQALLVAGQLALALVLLVGAGVLFDHVRRLQGMDLGFAVDEVATLRISVDQERYEPEAARLAFVRDLQERLRALPDVAAVGITTVNPLCCGDWGAPIEIEGREVAPGEQPALIHHRLVTPGFFDAMGIPVLRGSTFSESDGPENPPTVVVDDNLARRFWPGEDPIGKRIRAARPDSEWQTVVGVVSSIEQEGDYAERWYLPYYQSPVARSADLLHVMLRVRSEAALQAARAVVGEVDPGLGVYGASTMRALQDQRVSQDRLGSVVSGLFAAVGLLLAGFGVYGLLSYGVALRTRELGTRLALGAQRFEVLVMILRQALALVVVGGAVGLALAIALNRVLQSLISGVRMVDPMLLAGLVAGLAALGMVAALLPALRAARTDPTEAFRV